MHAFRRRRGLCLTRLWISAPRSPARRSRRLPNSARALTHAASDGSYVLCLSEGACEWLLLAGWASEHGYAGHAYSHARAFKLARVPLPFLFLCGHACARVARFVTCQSVQCVLRCVWARESKEERAWVGARAACMRASVSLCPWVYARAYACLRT
eukprot:6193138-Pleurochrysis_carterae.AAC.1